MKSERGAHISTATQLESEKASVFLNPRPAQSVVEPDQQLAKTANYPAHPSPRRGRLTTQHRDKVDQRMDKLLISSCAPPNGINQRMWTLTTGEQ